MLDKSAIFGIYSHCKIIDTKIIHKTAYKISALFFNDNPSIEYITGKGFNVSHLDDCKLILRPFDDMTKWEKRKFENLQIEDITTHIKGSSTEYLISIGIDVFNLKQKGFAVYESDLKGEN
jgi:hypothetical protein